MSTTLVDLVKAGVLGFAVAIMLLAFFALRNLMAKVDAPPAALALIAREIRIYMAVSLVVVILGIVWQLLNPKIQVVIDVSPQDIAGYDVRVAGVSMLPTLREVPLQHGSEIRLELVKFERQIRSLENQIQGLTAQTKELKEAQINRATTEGVRSKESGI